MVKYNKFQLSTNDTKWIFFFFQRQIFWILENEDGSKPNSTQVYRGYEGWDIDAGEPNTIKED